MFKKKSSPRKRKWDSTKQQQCSFNFPRCVWKCITDRNPTDELTMQNLKMLHYYLSWHLAVKRTYLMTLITRFAITNHLWLNWRFRLIRKCFTMGMAATQQQKSDMAKNQKGANKGAIE